MTTFQELLTQERKKDGVGRVAAVVMQLADTKGVTVEGLQPEDLDEFNLGLEDLTPEVRTRADRIYHDYSVSLNQRVKDWNDRFAPPEPAEQRFFVNEHAKRREKVFDRHTVTGVIRWMGSENWTAEQAKRVLTRLNLEVADGTIGIQLRAGRVGDKDRGPPANVSEREANKLYDLLV